MIFKQSVVKCWIIMRRSGRMLLSQGENVSVDQKWSEGISKIRTESVNCVVCVCATWRTDNFTKIVKFNSNPVNVIYLIVDRPIYIHIFIYWQLKVFTFQRGQETSKTELLSSLSSTASYEQTYPTSVRNATKRDRRVKVNKYLDEFSCLFEFLLASDALGCFFLTYIRLHQPLLRRYEPKLTYALAADSPFVLSQDSRLYSWNTSSKDDTQSFYNFSVILDVSIWIFIHYYGFFFIAMLRKSGRALDGFLSLFTLAFWTSWA